VNVTQVHGANHFLDYSPEVLRWLAKQADREPWDWASRPITIVVGPAKGTVGFMTEWGRCYYSWISSEVSG
jgi:hypothetical protein